MENRAHKRRRVLLIAAGALALLSGGFVLWYFEILPPPALSPPPSWHGITPGQTTLDEALEILGYPDEFDYRGGYRVYLYEDRVELDWRAVELWVEDRHDVPTVVGIVCTLPDPTQTLDQFVLTYGRPDRVTWSLLYVERILVWARHGVVVGANANARDFGWDRLQVGTMLYCEPMGVRRYTRMQFEWPWQTYGPVMSVWRFGPFVVGRNRYVGPEAPTDPFPEDPYDWEHMP